MNDATAHGLPVRGGQSEQSRFRLGQDAAGDEFLQFRAQALNVPRIGVRAQSLAELLRSHRTR